MLVRVLEVFTGEGDAGHVTALPVKGLEALYKGPPEHEVLL